MPLFSKANQVRMYRGATYVSGIIASACLCGFGYELANDLPPSEQNIENSASLVMDYFKGLGDGIGGETYAEDVEEGAPLLWLGCTVLSTSVSIGSLYRTRTLRNRA
jgi:hypothetical protein